MIQIDDNDMPIEAAQKIINGIKPYEPMDFEKSICKALSKDPKTEVFMFSVGEIEELANYLLVYVNSHKEGD